MDLSSEVLEIVLVLKYNSAYRFLSTRTRVRLITAVLAEVAAQVVKLRNCNLEKKLALQPQVILAAQA